MKFRIFTPVCAALVLAACSNSSDAELSDEALGMDEVATGAADMKMTLTPGQYRSTSELVEFKLPGLTPEMQKMAEQSFAEGAATGHTYCITKEMTPEQWVSQMNESDCTVSSFDESGGKMNVVLQCNDAEGMNGRIEMTGTVSGESADMDTRFTVKIPNLGDGQVHVKSKSERIGDCT